MKRFLGILLLLILLPGCSGDQAMEKALHFRQQLLSSQCSFDMRITADYGESLHIFAVSCQADTQGNVSFEVVEPESIAGIAGKLSQTDGALTFDDVALYFPLLVDELVTPVSAPWLLVRTLRGGYLVSAEETRDGLFVTADDSYADNALRMDIRMDGEEHPVSVEVIWKNRRILTMEITNFRFL